jgi:hypothetical protein
MSEYDSDEEFSDVSSIGSDLDDPRVDYCPVAISRCRAIYSPSSLGNSYICTRLPPCRRHNHQGANVPRGEPGVHPVDRTRTGRVRGVLNNRLPDADVQAMRDREREANRALAAAQAGMASPRHPPPPVETVAEVEEADAYVNIRPTSPSYSERPSSPFMEPTPPAPHDVAPAPVAPTLPVPQEDLTQLVAQLTNALLGLNSRLERLETQGTSTPAPLPAQAPLPAPTAPPRKSPHPAPESILRTSVAKRSPEVEFLGAQGGQSAEFVPTPQAWYVVLKGRTPKDIGIYDNWLVVQPMVTGVSHAVYKKFKTEPEAEYYLAAALHSMNLNPAPTTGSPPPTNASGHQRDPLPSLQSPAPRNLPPASGTPYHGGPREGLNQATPPRSTSRVRTDSPGNRSDIREPGVIPAGADPSGGQKDTLYGLHANEDGSIMRSCTPPGLTKEGQIRLADQVLDAVALPGTSDGGTDETELHRISESLQAIAGGRNSKAGYPVGQQDNNYKAKRKTSICDIRSTADLQDRLEDLEGGAEDILKYTEGNLKAVLINEGYEYDVATEYASLSPYLKISQVSMQSYISLHLHLLSIAVNEGYEEAKLELAHHCKKMRRIRERYHTRLQVMCHLYCYLRDQKRNRWQSLEIQKLRLDQARKFLPFVPASLVPPASAGSDYRCAHCRTCIHTGGKKSCPWRNLSVKKAISAAKQALSQIQALGPEALGGLSPGFVDAGDDT